MPSNIIHPQCVAIISVGPNIGLQCTNRQRTGYCYCTSHIRLYGWIKS